MAFKLLWDEGARDDLAGLDKSVARMIIDKVKGHLVSDPHKLGKPLRGIFKGLYRFRCGNWRVIYVLDREEESVMILRVGHRRDIYQKK